MTEQYTAPAPVAPPQGNKFHRLAWTAVILGLVGITMSWIPILNILSAIGAGLGVLFGAIALFGTRKLLAGIGIAACVLAIVVTVNVQAKLVEDLDKAFGDAKVNDGTISGGTATQAEPAGDKPADKIPTWGEQFTWPDKVGVKVSAPESCIPSRLASPGNVERGVRFTVTVYNDSGKALDAGLMLFSGEAQFAGAKAPAIFDAEGGCDSTALSAATVLPGKTYEYTAAFAVGAQPGEMQLVFQPSFTGPKAVFVGQV